MPPPLRLSYENLKTHARIPIWTFAGVFLVIIGTTLAVVSDKNRAQKVSKLILSPKKDDIFEIKLKDDAYTLYKVQSVANDTVYFFANKYQTNKQTGLSDLVEKGFDTDMTYGLSKSMLIEMDKKEEILDIDRK
ncbi:MAG TPA: hypothetical protein VK668_06555 [Mucilaginibacter sp.]|nr:hypothetical protein [Mucilaginibacter sp.]